MLSSSSQGHVFVMDRHVVSLICKKRQEKVVSLTRYSNLSHAQPSLAVYNEILYFCISFLVHATKKGKSGPTKLIGNLSVKSFNHFEYDCWLGCTMCVAAGNSIGDLFCATTTVLRLLRSLLDWSLNGRGESPRSLGNESYFSFLSFHQ